MLWNGFSEEFSIRFINQYERNEMQYLSLTFQIKGAVYLFSKNMNQNHE